MVPDWYQFNYLNYELIQEFVLSCMEIDKKTNIPAYFIHDNKEIHSYYLVITT